MTGYPTYYPVVLNLEGRKVVVIGGDEEAACKVHGLLATGALITVISPAAKQSIRELAGAGELTLLERTYCDGDLAGAAMAIACDLESAAVMRDEATREHVLLNMLDRPELCDFIAPATVARDGLQVSVHSSGRSAALTRRVREKLEVQFGPQYATLAGLLGELRPVVRRMIPLVEDRHAFWLGAVSQALLDRVEAGLDPEQLRAEILQAAEDFGRVSIAVGDEA